MQEIKEWLAGEEKDFVTGLQLFQKYSRNRALILYLVRKQNMDKLVYELEKLSCSSSLKPVIQVKNTRSFVDRVINKKTSLSSDDHDAKEDLSKKISKVNREDLPVDLQQVYDSIADAYKTQRVVHEKMKLAETDEARADIRSELIGLDDLIADGWDQIDAFLAGKTTDTEPPQDVVKQVNSARTYISREIKNFNPEKLDKLLERINLLIEQKASVSEKTREKLIELNVITPESNLLVK